MSHQNDQHPSVGTKSKPPIPVMIGFNSVKNPSFDQPTTTTTGSYQALQNIFCCYVIRSITQYPHFQNNKPLHRLFN